MENIIMEYKTLGSKFVLSVLVTFFLSLSTAIAGELNAETQKKVDTYKQKLATWAQDPDVVSAIKKANQQGTQMDNTKWKAMSKSDGKVLSYQYSSAGKKLTQWNADKSLGKLFIRDKKGNYVAGSKKPAIYNIASRPAFSKAKPGQGWNSTKVKPDPTTNLASIQVSYPVISNGETIGLIHTSVIVE